MTREEAIAAIQGAFAALISDYTFCYSDEDDYRKMRDDALRALGVTDEELS